MIHKTPAERGNVATIVDQWVVARSGNAKRTQGQESLHVMILIYIYSL